MSDDESVRPAAEPTPAEPASPPEPAPATEPIPVVPAPVTAAAPAEPAAAAEPEPAPAAKPEPAAAAEPAEPEPAEPAQAAEPGPAEPAPAVEPAPGPAGPTQPGTSPADISPPVVQAKATGGAVAFLKAHAVTLVLAVLLVAAIVWGALGMTSAASWESRAGSLSADLASAEEHIADAEATIDDLETAKSRAESTATACIGAIADADAMLEVSAKIDEKTVAYVNGLNDFIAAVNARDVAAVETIGAEMDKLSAQIEDLSAQIDGHIEDYGDSAEGCHVDDAQDV